MESVFFDSTESVLRTLIAAPALYLVVIGFIQLSGKRSTSKLNNFDWIVTVAMGSLLASGIILKDVSLAEVVLAVGLMLGFQFLVTRFLPRSAMLRALVKAEPRLLLRDGAFLEDALRGERVTKREVIAAVRGKGITDLRAVAAVVLETDASLSVIPQSMAQTGHASTLDDVAGWAMKREQQAVIESESSDSFKPHK